MVRGVVLDVGDLNNVRDPMPAASIMMITITITKAIRLMADAFLDIAAAMMLFLF